MIEHAAVEGAALEALQLEIRGWKDRKAELPLVRSDNRPADYKHDLNRGTVDYDPAWRNYSFHTVRIPAGSEVRNANFSQAAPDTPALISDGDVVLIACNLVNCRVEPWMKIVGGNTAQIYRTQTDAIYVTDHPSKLTEADRVPPVDAVIDGPDRADVETKQAALDEALKGK